MLVKIDPSGDTPPLDYQLGLTTSSGRVRTTAPLVIGGDPAAYMSKYRQLAYTRKETKFILSYHELDNPTNSEAALDVDFLRSVLIPGLDVDEFIDVAILHRQDRDGVVCADVHYDILNQHLPTRTHHNPYYHKSDLPRVDLAKRILNLVRGYQEPASPEHSRIFGHTATGSKAHELAEVIEDIGCTVPLDNREEVAMELERRGYRVLRRKKGQIHGRKYLTVTMPDGAEVKLFGVGATRAKARIVSHSSVAPADQMNEMIDRLNRMCRKKARRNWLRYKAKSSELTEKEAERQAFGFVPFNVNQFRNNHHESKKQRIGFFNPREAKSDQSREPSHPQPASQSGSENGSHGEAVGRARQPPDAATGRAQPRSRQPPRGSGESKKSGHDIASSADAGRSRELAKSIEQATSGVKKLISRFVKRAKQRLRPPIQKSKRRG